MRARRLAFRIVATLLILILLVVAGAGAFGYYTLRKPLPVTSGTLIFAGLSQSVDVYRDAAGVPHIYASTTDDLMFALGIVHAQDRWWQMEFNRHVSLGRISELVGYNENALATDTFIRTAGWNRTAAQDTAALDPDTLSVLEAYSRGVNAYTNGKQGGDLAIEYSLLGVQGVSIPIEAWLPLHSVAWGNALSWDLSSNYGDELDYADAVQHMGAQADTLMRDYMLPYPLDYAPTIITKEDLPTGSSTLQLSTPTDGGASGTESFSLQNVATALVGGASRRVNAGLGSGAGIGSNNWVIAGSRTASGKPILANDPHIDIQMPSIWYQVGLHCRVVDATCPYDVEGFSFAGVPAVVIGRNAHIAWGVTNAYPDTQDLYAIKVDPNDDTRYELDGKTESMQVITETIRFGDDTPPRDIRVRLTRFGTIITDSSSSADRRMMPLALKYAAAIEPKNIVGSALAINRAANWTEFRAAVALWKAPSQNFVYADVDGNIGYQAPGDIPIRANGHTGVAPVDGSTTQYDWKGYIPFENLPFSYNPARGYIQSANQYIAPPEYYSGLLQQLGGQFGTDSNYVINTEFAFGNRGKRIVELIEGTPKHTIESVQQMQGDNYSYVASLVVPALTGLDYGGQLPAEVVSWLGTWDHHNRIESGQAALYNAFWKHLCTDLWSDQLGYVPGGYSRESESVRLLLGKPDNLWWDDTNTPDVQEKRDDILKKSLVGAYNELSTALGNDYQKWTWGALHTATFVSTPLGASGIDLIERLVNGGPVGVSGGTDVVNATNWNADASYAVSSAPSMRMIVDFADFDSSLWIHTTGQSGHPLSNHYRDQIEKWRLLQYNPMVWSAEKIQAGSSKLTLQPG